MSWGAEHRRAAHAANRERQERHDEMCREHFSEFRAARMSYSAMAAALNERKVSTPGRFLEGRPGGTWNATMAKRIHDRLYLRCQKTGDLFAATDA